MHVILFQQIQNRSMRRIPEHCTEVFWRWINQLELNSISTIEHTAKGKIEHLKYVNRDNQYSDINLKT